MGFDRLVSDLTSIGRDILKYSEGATPTYRLCHKSSIDYLPRNWLADLFSGMSLDEFLENHGDEVAGEMALQAEEPDSFSEPVEDVESDWLSTRTARASGQHIPL
jgi:hypothetical protein